MLAVHTAQPAASSPPLPSAGFGVYVHFPWCERKCPYCDFLSVPVTERVVQAGPYTEAVLGELDLRAASLSAHPLRTIFVGGGTPSLWDPVELRRVLTAIRARFPTEDALEVTVECNPSSFDERVAEGLLAAGVNRISLGVQSLSDDRLRFLGRVHDTAEALAAVQRALRTGFERVSADLIFGVAGQTPGEAADEARRLAGLGLTHLSAYALTIEPGTRFGERARRGRLPLLSDDVVAECFTAIEEALEGAGFAHYEISNYAHPGAEARHNLGYWRGAPYLGLGVGAFGTLPATHGALRYRNTPNLDRYLGFASRPTAALDRVGPLVASVEPLAPPTLLSERLMLGLRLAEGIDTAELERTLGVPVLTRARERAIERWTTRGALVRDGSRLRLDKRHFLLADAVIRDLV
nr:MAG: coproporphyrinogen III oxidase [Pseudomonadota bacterium]